MTIGTHPIRKIFARFFPKKYGIEKAKESPIWGDLSEGQKKELAYRYLFEGEIALLQGSLRALSLFESASELDGENPEQWYRQGLSFFEYGSEEGKEKFLLLASKQLKIATQLDPAHLDAWTAWGNALFQLGTVHEERHFFLESKERYEQAIALLQKPTSPEAMELFWDYALSLLEIASFSGEAIDVKAALDAFQRSLELQHSLIPEFLTDFAKAHFEMGLLINDPLSFQEAEKLLFQALQKEPLYFEGWTFLGEVLSQLYLSTMDERYVSKAGDAFQKAIKLSSHSSQAWLSWGQILAESGKSNGEIKHLRQSVEACARASTIDPEDPEILSQWVESLSLLGAESGRLDLILEAEQKVTKAIETHLTDPDLCLAHGYCYVALGKYFDDAEYYELAIEKLQEGLSIDRSSAEHWQALGTVHFLYAKQTHQEELFERSRRFFAKAIDLKPGCPSLLFEASQSLLEFYETTLHLPPLEEAIRFLETLLQSPHVVLVQHPQWLFAYGRALRNLFEASGEESHLNKAIEIFSHLLLIDPDFPGTYEKLADTYVQMGHQMGETHLYKKANAFYRLSLRGDEENEHLWLDWGLCQIHLAELTKEPLLQEELFWEGEQKIAKAGRLGHPGAYYQLACVHSLLGKTETAMQFIEKALEARALPPIEEMLADEWLDPLKQTDEFLAFLKGIETKLEAREE